MSAQRTIVVGYDESEGSRAALRWALDEAKLRGARLRVVSAWHVPPTIYAGMAPVPDVGDVISREAEKAVGNAAESVRGEGVDVETEVTEGAAADVLVRRAADAELLVVGSRGLGGFGGLLLGSVSQQVAHHAPCPVVIVRAAPPAAG